MLVDSKRGELKLLRSFRKICIEFKNMFGSKLKVPKIDRPKTLKLRQIKKN